MATDIAGDIQRGSIFWISGNMRFTGAVFIVLGLVFFGCNRSATSLASHYDELFKSADAPIKAGWESAKAAMQTNGFAEATFALKALQEASLKPEQLTAVNETVNAVSHQMYEAANKGDSNAISAIEKLAPPRR